MDGNTKTLLLLLFLALIAAIIYWAVTTDKVPNPLSKASSESPSSFNLTATGTTGPAGQAGSTKYLF